MAEKEPKESERKPLSKTARKAIQYLNAHIQQEMQEILEADAAAQGLSGEWKYDMKALEWVRAAE